MACTVSFTINDFTFAFHVGLGTGDGVVVDPSQHKPNAVGFLEALTTAVKMYPDVEATLWLDELSTYASDEKQLQRHLRNSPDEYLEKIAEAWTKAKNQTYLEVTDAMRLYAAAMFSERQRRATPKKEREADKKQPSKGFVYLIQSPTGAYKIGRTKDPHNRMKTFGVKLPFEVEYTCLIETENMYDLEARLHKLFAPLRLNGEWFSLTPTEVEFIMGLSSGGAM